MTGVQTCALPIFAPPEIPEEAARIQREAFASMMKAPDFLAEAGRSLMEINQPMPAAEMTKLIEELHGADPGVVKRAAELVGN